MKNALTLPLLLLACVSGFLPNPLAAQPVPVISSFAASPAVTNPGTVTNLSWSVSNATSISIDQGVEDVTGANSIYLGPVQTTTYTLTAIAGSSSGGFAGGLSIGRALICVKSGVCVGVSSDTRDSPANAARIASAAPAPSRLP
jgi:hypothetical protein